MKKLMTISFLVGLALVACSCGSGSSNSDATDNKKEEVTTEKVQYLTTADFIAKVYDYKTNKDWVFKGDKPVVIDFYATWCKPCQKVAPIMEELATEYEGRVVFYKVDTDKEQELAATFNIQSIPSMLFIPMEGKPTMSTGAFPKEEYVKIIESVIFKK